MTPGKLLKAVAELAKEVVTDKPHIDFWSAEDQIVAIKQRFKQLQSRNTPWVEAAKVAESGEWWFWDGHEDNAAVPVTIMRDSGQSFFACAGQLGWKEPQMVLDLGGWWKKIPYPERPCDEKAT